MKSQRNILTYINGEIERNEKEKSTHLGQRDREVLVSVCVETVDKLCSKFVAGSVKHGGSVLDRPALPELEMELLDAIVYFKAAKLQLTKMI